LRFEAEGEECEYDEEGDEARVDPGDETSDDTFIHELFVAFVPHLAPFFDAFPKRFLK
jgi:hypothetical protein